MHQTINQALLTQTAFDILVADLESHGNILSEMHRAALMELLDTFAGYAVGTQSGRQAFPLPTGMGKTSAVVAFIAALEHLSYEVPVSVAASKVDALVGLYEALVEHGVPTERIGIKHAVAGKTIASTGNEEHVYQLVTHARIRGGSDFKLFGQYQGEARPLTIYDESLFRSDAFAFSELDVRLGAQMLPALTEDSPELQGLTRYLTHAASLIKAALDVLKTSGDIYRNGVPVSLPEQDEAVLAAWAVQLQKLSRVRSFAASAEVLSQLLAVSQTDLQVLTSDQGAGIVSVRVAVPPALRNVVILDASGPIRELIRMDPTITSVESFDPQSLKSFEDVQVFQLLAAGGRQAIEQTYSAENREVSALSLEVLDIIKRESQEDPSRAFLIFSFRKRKVDVLERLRNDMRRAGIDPDAVRPDGKSRFVFLTWGMHEALNGHEHCQTVILAGVLHRSHLDISALIKGQQDNLAAPTPSDLVRHVLDTELAHACYQAASRGSCRRVINGKAVAMRLHVVHRGLKLKTILEKVMPGAVWSYPEPKHMKKAEADGRAAAMLGQLLEHLATLPEGTSKVSSRQLKAAMGISADAASEHAFKAAAAALETSEHGWTRQGRSVVRAAVAYGFQT